MIFAHEIDTLYPCVNCRTEIPPTHKFCHECGAKQPSLDERFAFNVFSYSKRENSFHARYAGGPILDLKEIQDLLDESDFTSEGGNYFVGTYKATAELEHGSRLVIKNWFPVTAAGIGLDLGERTITITAME